MIYYFFQKEWRLKKLKSLQLFYMKKLNAFHMRNLKQALNHGLVFKKDYRVIKVNRHAWLKPYINMNRDLTKKKMFLEKLFSVDE